MISSPESLTSFYLYEGKSDKSIPSLEHILEPTTSETKVSFMSLDKVLKALQDNEATVFSEIPVGQKENMFFVIDNSDNIKRRRQGKRSTFVDDCGIWDSKSASTKTFVYIWNNNKRTAKVCVYKDNLCGKMDGKQFFPFATQPSESEVLVFKKSLAHLKRKFEYRRKVSWVETAPSGLEDTLNKALVEYIGSAPMSECYHGNMKKYTHTYARTSTKVMEELKEFVPTMSAKDAYKYVSEKTGLPVNERVMKIAGNIKYPKQKLDHTNLQELTPSCSSLNAEDSGSKFELISFDEGETSSPLLNDDTKDTEKKYKHILADSDHTTIYVCSDDQWETINSAISSR